MLLHLFDLAQWHSKHQKVLGLLRFVFVCRAIHKSPDGHVLDSDLDISEDLLDQLSKEVHFVSRRNVLAKYFFLPVELIVLAESFRFVPNLLNLIVEARLEFLVGFEGDIQPGDIDLNALGGEFRNVRQDYSDFVKSSLVEDVRAGCQEGIVDLGGR